MSLRIPGGASIVSGFIYVVVAVVVVVLGRRSTSPEESGPRR